MTRRFCSLRVKMLAAFAVLSPSLALPSAGAAQPATAFHETAHVTVRYEDLDLGVTAGAASLQVRALEEYLGRPLFRRDGRSVQLTEDGAALLPRAQEALSQRERAIDDTRADRHGGQLRISTLASFLQQWLLPRLADFRALHPGIDLHLHTGIWLVDFVRTEHHAAVRLGTGGWPGVHAEKLMDEWLVPVCTPALLERHGPLHGGEDLGRCPLLHNVTEPWTTWLIGGRIDDSGHADGSGSRYDDSVATVRAALVAASSRPVRYARSYWFVCPARSRTLPLVAAFRDWLFAQAAVFPAPPG
jgi:LysR family glycine cleavage system transcriptional activator